MIYLDNAATTKPCKESVKAAAEAAANCFANAGSLHKLGTASINLISRAKSVILNALSLDGELVFTSGATESNNLALFGANIKGNVVSTAIEHPSVARCLDRLEERGIVVKRLAPKDSDDLVGAIIDAVNEKTSLVSAMAVNNETGFHIDVKRLYDGVKAKNSKTLVHIDAVQGFLKVPLDGDLISFSGHKIHALKGIGGLYIKRGTPLKPIIFGGGQQKNLRSGTEPVELIASLSAAVSAYSYNFSRFEAMKSLLLKELSEIPDIKINSDENCLPNIVNFSVRGVRSEIMLHSLEEAGICVSSGSACSRGKTSGVLSAFGASDKDADCAVRVSMCAENTEDELLLLAKKAGETAARVRR